jgi:hypothetical protein
MRSAACDYLGGRIRTVGPSSTRNPGNATHVKRFQDISRELMFRAKRESERSKVGEVWGFSAVKCGVSYRRWFVHSSYITSLGLI